ncbi:acyl carrier protein [Nocardioides luteus]|uniref:acyl carrier protein n=1 Tax=Nocardioides luteus TaxID=1844 RepID=UPI0018CBE9DF|nr:acyl carrier protein [Nocardioides luteus]MBG6096986.1 acyl carrier protein [Nocardioides luteus]
MTHDATMSPAAARAAIAAVIRRIVPDADLDGLADDDPIRAELELDSLDFLSFVELLSDATGIRIDESDYPDLSTMARAISFLTARGTVHGDG